MSEAGDRRYTLGRFVEATVWRELREGLFELESERILDINLDGSVVVQPFEEMVLQGGSS